VTPLDVRSIAKTKPITLHETVTVHSLIPKYEKHDETRDTYLEFFDVFEVAPGHKIEPHFHNTHEWYFVLQGPLVVQIEDQARRLIPGDLIYIPPNARHTAWTDGEERVRAIAFACSYQKPEGLGYVPCELPEVEPTRDGAA
jgi:quercetin dioxygenase-like cupin family protein